MKFLGVGAFATLLQYVLLIAQVELFAIDVVLASCIGFAISATFNYLLNYYLTFNSSERHSVAALRFSMVVSAGLLLNAILMFILYTKIGLQYLIAQMLATLVVLCFNFLAHRNWTYKATSD